MDSTDADAYHAAEPDPVAAGAAYAIEHLNDDHADALLRWPRSSAATRTRPRRRCVRIDRYGLDLHVQTPRGFAETRIAFAEPANRARRPARRHGRARQARTRDFLTPLRDRRRDAADRRAHRRRAPRAAARGAARRRRGDPARVRPRRADVPRAGRADRARAQLDLPLLRLARRPDRRAVRARHAALAGGARGGDGRPPTGQDARVAAFVSTQLRLVAHGSHRMAELLGDAPLGPAVARASTRSPTARRRCWSPSSARTTRSSPPSSSRAWSTRASGCCTAPATLEQVEPLTVTLAQTLVRSRAR